MSEQIPTAFYTQLEQELNSILEYWKTNSVDEEHGGFVGKRDHYNNLVAKADKGIILNSRLLWSFSAVANYSQNDELLLYMKKAYLYLKEYFQDKKYGGVYWELDYEGNPINKKKQIYAQAFTIYGLAEFYKYTKDEEAKKWAIELFRLIERHALDQEKEGYIEAFEEDWSPIEDMRLSDKDENASKTMNTHLHILEAYTSLLHIHSDESIQKALVNLVQLFLEKFLNEDYNFELFFDNDWNLVENSISFGHDIEAAWLLIEASKATKNEKLIKKTKDISVHIAKRFLKKGYIKGKGVINEEDRTTGKIDTDRHWWPQVEAMVGLYYVYMISAEEKFAEAMLDIWDYTKKHLIDHQNGEWHFRVDEENKPYQQEDKLSMWKSFYHNSRACIILLKQEI